MHQRSGDNDDGNEILVRTYIVKPDLREKFVAPNAEYLSICEKGFKTCGIETESLTLAATNQPIPKLSALFAYGTIMRGEQRFSALVPHGLTCAITAFCFGTLTTNNSYPALNLEGNGHSRGDYFVSSDISSLQEINPNIKINDKKLFFIIKS